MPWSMHIGFASSPRFVEHDTGPNHPECPDRIRAIYAALTQCGLLNVAKAFPEFELDFGPMQRFSTPLLPVPFEPADLRWVQMIHSAQYIDRIRSLSARGELLDGGDTPSCPESFEIALLALGAVLGCCDAVAGGQVQRAFAAIRPPGHHAEPNRPMGFCLFSNVAIAARYLQQKHGVGRLAIVDFDVHHGNGTQACFESDPSVYYASLHENPRTCYPGSGFDWEIGTGAGRQSTLNIPFDAGAGDEDYLLAMEERVVPELDRYRPEFLLISAGFDAHVDDPLANINLTETGFERLTRLLVEVAERHCNGRIVSALEGGYNLRAMPRSLVRHLAGLGAQ